MANRDALCSSQVDPAELAKTMAEFLLENPPQASTPELQAKRERLLRILAGSSSTEPREDSTGLASDELQMPVGKLPKRPGESEMDEEGEEHGIQAKKQRRESVQKLEAKRLRSSDTAFAANYGGAGLSDLDRRLART